MSLPVSYTLAKLPQQVRSAVVNGAYTKVGVVRSVVPQDGQPAMAIVDFDDERGVEAQLLAGKGTPTYPGMTVRVERQGGIIDATWKIVDVLASPRISFGEPVVALMAKPVVPGASFGGVYTESNTATADNPNAIADPGAAVKARVYLYVRSIVLGSYSAYQQRAKAIRVQGRELGDTEWPAQFTDWPINPASTLYGYSSGSITASTTAITFVTALDRINEMLIDQPAYWQIESEIFLAIASTTVTPGQYTLTVVAHNGVDDATLGQGFVASASGRGLEGTTAASHDHNSPITLLSASVAPGDLRPATDYEIRVAFVNASGQAGPWSDVVGITTWEQPVPPAAVDNLTVEQLGTDLQANWDAVITDANGEPRSDVKRYIAVRFTAALTASFTLAQVLSAGATQVADTSATVISVPATKGAGNFIGVAAVGSEGLLSSWQWSSDTLAPPYPDPDDVTFTSIPRGIQVNIPTTSDSRNAQTGATVSTPAYLDPGFKEFWLWKADDSSGTNAAVVAIFTTISNSWKQDSGLTGWFKVTTADGAGNSNGPATYPAGVAKAGQSNTNTANWSSGWKFCGSLYAEKSVPPNGNFQDPNETNTDARDWTRSALSNGSGPTFGSVISSYEANGGFEGNRSYKIITTESATGAFVTLFSHGKVFLLPAHNTSAVGSIWIYSSLAMNVEAEFSMLVLDSTNALLGTYIQSSGAVAIPANAWTKISISSGSVRAAYPGAVAGQMSFNVRSTGFASRTYTWYVDAIQVTFS